LPRRYEEEASSEKCGTSTHRTSSREDGRDINSSGKATSAESRRKSGHIAASDGNFDATCHLLGGAAKDMYSFCSRYNLLVFATLEAERNYPKEWKAVGDLVFISPYLP
jgi:hypothetical protein